MTPFENRTRDLPACCAVPQTNNCATACPTAFLLIAYIRDMKSERIEYRGTNYKPEEIPGAGERRRQLDKFIVRRKEPFVAYIEAADDMNNLCLMSRCFTGTRHKKIAVI